MKKEKLYIALILVAFVASFILSFFYIFTLSKVELKCEALTGEQVSTIQTAVSEFEGENLLFLDTDKIKDKVSSFTDYKIVSVEKKYPSTVVVTIKERVETFAIVNEGSAVIIDDEGYVLRVDDDFSSSRELVTLNFNGLTLSNATVGQVVTTSDNEMLFAVMAMAKKVNYYNCIKSIELERAVEKRFAYFNTYTGVQIEVPDVLIRGEEKILYAFNEYDSCDSDFIKSFDKIIVFIKQDGNLGATWVKNG